MYDPDKIEPISDAELGKIKGQIEQRWLEKPHYPGGEDPMNSPGCMMRASEILSLIKRAELAKI